MRPGRRASFKANWRWAYQNDVTFDFSRSGESTGAAFIKAFIGRLGDERLNTHGFRSLGDARKKREDWPRDCNEVRPQGAIGDKPPMARIN